MFGEDDETMLNAKYRHIVKIVNENNGNKTRAAKCLGVTIQTLRRWIKALRLMGADFSIMKDFQR